LGGEEMSIELATIISGVLIMIGIVVAGGAIYAGLQNIADALNKEK
jgi:hypothetical protein